MSLKKLLIIDDEAFKARRIEAFISSLKLPVEIAVERSVTSGLTALFSDGIAGLILDMSLSTFDVGAREGGGRPQNFGGITVLEHMRRRKRNVPVIVITQFPAFKRDGADVSLDCIASELRTTYPAIFRKIVYYSSREVGWENELSEALIDLRLESQ